MVMMIDYIMKHIQRTPRPLQKRKIPLQNITATQKCKAAHDIKVETN